MHRMTVYINKVPRKPVVSYRSSLTVDSDVSETEIAAEISVPKEGSWGWVVVAASFVCMFILDGTFYSFGSLYKDMAQDLQIEESFVALINSVTMALYFTIGPIVSALINRFGFRFCTMTGSIIISSSYFLSQFSETFLILLILYGIIPGLGGCFIFMSSQLVVGFYFERFRALAMALAGLGQSFGVMIMSRVNTYLCNLAGWRTATLLHSGMFGLIYFIGMAFRPLVSLTVTQTMEEARAVTYLPSLSAISLTSLSRKRLESKPVVNAPTAAERMFKAVSNINFPTVADLLEEEDEEVEKAKEGEDDEEDEEDEEEEKIETKPGPSSKAVPSNASFKSIRTRRFSIKESEIVIKKNEPEPEKKLKWWQKCCRWEKHVEESRPMYRDDAFYTGTLQRLPAYQKSLMSTKRKKTGLEYRMAVSRTVTPDDLRERKGFFTTAIRRTLATMLDTTLLKRCSFLMLCATGFVVHVGVLVPYIFLTDRNLNAGIDQKHCNWFVSVIGCANAVGRLMAGLLACKLDPIMLYSLGCLISGTASILSNFSYDIYYQYSCCVMFGIAVAHMSTLRSLVVVDLYGLQNLTNATGVLLMFQGFGLLLSTPLASVLKIYFGYLTSFCTGGGFMILGGLILFKVKHVALNEDEEEQQRLAKAKYKKKSVSRVIIKNG